MFKLNLIASSFFMVFFAGSASSFAQDAKEVQPNLSDNFYYEKSDADVFFNSYESQFVSVIKSTVNPTADRFGFDSSKVKVLKDFIDLFSDGKMLLKNVVYRSDTKYIRITFASKDDRFVIKGTYDTSFDDVLVNSNYADKKKLIDLKIMYMIPDDKNYEYFHIFNTNRKSKNGDSLVGVEPETTGATCKYCHDIVKVNGNPSGLFFQRYQYGNSSENPLHSEILKKMSGIFIDSNFVKGAAPDWLPAGFSDQSVGVFLPKNDIYKNIQNRNLILESPELLETFSMDNKKSYCVAFTLNGINNNKVDYVCTDYPKKMVYVKFNRQGDGYLVNYTHPFYVKPNLGEVNYREDSKSPK